MVCCVQLFPTAENSLSNECLRRVLNFIIHYARGGASHKKTETSRSECSTRKEGARNALLIFDWDDTILPTTHLTESSRKLGTTLAEALRNTRAGARIGSSPHHECIYHRCTSSSLHVAILEFQSSPHGTGTSRQGLEKYILWRKCS